MTQDREAAEQLFTGNSEMAMRMRSLNWSQTLLGPIDTWPQSLRSALSICLNSRFPIAIYWGADCLLLYNDAWRPIVGDKHPWSLGRPAREVWSEIWNDIGPELAGVLATGEGTFHNDELLAMHRYGYTEECFFEYTFNPIQGEGGGIDGVFNIVTETTYRVLNDRRARLLREVASKTGTAKTTEEACSLMVETLRSDPADIPFALLYLMDQDGSAVHLCGSTEIGVDRAIAPEVVDLAADDTNGWSIALVAQTAQPQIIHDLVMRFGALPGNPWTELPQEAMVLPIVAAGQTKVTGVLVAVASPRRKLDENYVAFFTQVAGQIAMAITNAYSYEEERKRAEALAELDRAKTVFFSNVSHEFRTPLTLMLGPAEDALSDPNEPLSPQQRERIAIVQRNGQRLLKLVNTLLDFSRIEAGRVQAVYEPIDLAAFTAELASVFRSAIERANLHLVIDCPPLPERVHVDREMWEKIVLNLLSNAFKFTFEGEIRVRLRLGIGEIEGDKPVSSSSAILEVCDTGIGIPASELPHLFERFHRVKGSQGRSFEGSGIGLSLVQELVKLHQGTIEVASVEGEGTCFTITIPTGTAHLPQDRVSAARSLTSTALGVNSYVEEALRWLPEENWATDELTDGLTDGLTDELTDDAFVNQGVLFEQTNHSSALSASKSAARILLADDNADMRNYVKRLLGQQYKVEAVSDGVAALAAARQQVPDLVLTDVMMPKLDGFGLLQALRAEPQTREVPIILLSARAGEEARVEGLEAGADDYLTKPFSARELIARVEASLKLAHLRRQATQQEQLLRLEAEAVRARLESVLAGLNDQFLVLDREWRYTFVNEQVIATTGKRPEELLGKSIWDMFPDTIGSQFDIAVRRAVAEQTFVQVEVFYPPLERWFENRIYPFAEGVTVFVSDISDRKRYELEREELLAREQAARAEAEKASRIKDEFLAVLSHELRSPLNPILGWSKLLQNRNLDEARTRQALATIERNARLQSELIEDLLDVSRILQGKLSLNINPVNLVTTIQAAIETVRLAAETKSIQIETRLDPEMGLASGDPTRLQQVIWNLLSNAVKFTPPGGQVTVQLESADNQAQITVRDNGRGITSEFLPYVFDYFRQADSTTTRKFGGLGLGLAIVRHLVELHGGTIEADSPGEGLGATFTIKLPLMPMEPEVSQESRSPESFLNLQGIQVLVVDDDTDTREFVVFLLEQAGASIVSVSSAGEAFAALMQSQPDVLISDIGMPEMDGYMLIQQIRALPSQQGGQIPAIALTAYAGEINYQQAMAAGFQKHISKPVDPAKLVEAVAGVVTGSGSTKRGIGVDLKTVGQSDG